MVDISIYQRNIFNIIEIRRSQNINKLLNCKIVYTIETKVGLRLESQLFANWQVILAFLGLPTFRKKYGNGTFVLADKPFF